MVFQLYSRKLDQLIKRFLKKKEIWLFQSQWNIFSCDIQKLLDLDKYTTVRQKISCYNRSFVRLLSMLCREPQHSVLMYMQSLYSRDLFWCSSSVSHHTQAMPLPSSKQSCLFYFIFWHLNKTLLNLEQSWCFIFASICFSH